MIPDGDIFDEQSSHTVATNNIQPNVKKLKVFQIKDEIETVEMDQESWDQNKDFIQDELIRIGLQKYLLDRTIVFLLKIICSF